MSATVLLPAGLCRLGTERLLLTFADDDQAVGRDAEALQIILHSVRAARAEAEVVLGAATRVAVPFDRHLRARPSLHPLRVLLQRAPRVVAKVRLVEVGEH